MMDSTKGWRSVNRLDTQDGLNRHLDEAFTRVFGKVVCASCRLSRPLEGGVYRMMGGARRFFCASCSARRAESMKTVRARRRAE